METDFPIDRLLAFIDGLPDSFAKGASQQVAVRELILRLIDSGEMPPDPRRLCTLLAPAVCTTPDQQREFYERFETWLTSKPSYDERRPIHARRWPWITVVVLLIASASAGLYVIQSIRKVPPPPLPPAPGLPVNDSGSSDGAAPSNSIRGAISTLNGLDGLLSVEISSATIGERHAHATGAPSWVSSARPQTSIRSTPVLDSNTHKRRNAG